MSNPNPKTNHLIPTQWQPGVSGNENGKPKGTKHVATWVRELLESPHPSYNFTTQGEIPIQVIIKAMIVRAASGDVRAFEALVKAGYGHSSQPPIDRELPIPILGGVSTMILDNIEI